MEDVQLLIGGQNRAAADNATFTRLNPVTGEVATRASAASVADARAAADAAAAAFPKWAALGPSERRSRLVKAADAARAAVAGVRRPRPRRDGRDPRLGALQRALRRQRCCGKPRR